MSEQGNTPISSPHPSHRNPPGAQPVPPVPLEQPPVRDTVLDYEVPEPPEHPDMPQRQQFILGMLSPFAYGVPAFLLAYIASGVGILPDSLIVWLLLAGYPVLVIWTALRWRWRAFLAGMLVTILGLLLMSVLLCA